MRQIEGMLYTEAFQFEAGILTIDGDRIMSVELCGEEGLTPEQRERYILPGLIDIHFHGCAGYDFCDGFHIHPSVVRNTFRLFGAKRTVLVSDSMMATGMVNGGYALGGQPVYMKDGLATLADGTIAGSVTHLFDCMKMAVQMGVPREDAVRATTYNPAVVIGIDGECGNLCAGKKADILITDHKFNLREVIKSGIRAMSR